MALKLERPQKLELVRDLQQYLSDELEVEPGDLATELLLDFVVELIDPHIYNQALYDARTAASHQAEALDEALIALEHTPKTRRGGSNG